MTNIFLEDQEYSDYDFNQFMLNIPKSSRLDTFKYNVSLLYKKFIYKIKDTAAVLKGIKLADNIEYVGASRVSQEEVEMNPRKWIIEECILACQILWKKNIYTFMCSDGLDQNAWIELELDCLSEENLAILEEIKSEYPCYKYHEGCINIPVKGKGMDAQRELVKIASRFVMQDVPSKYAIISREDLLIEMGCYREIPNPDYLPFEELLSNISFDNWHVPILPETLLILDESKIEKPVTTYINEYGAIVDYRDGTIYRSLYHYDKHVNYLKYLDSLEDRKELN